MVGFVRGAIEFTDGSALHYRELVDLRQPLRLVMYSYHYQGADGKLIFRYDNAAHHMQVNTFPHHKHIGDKDIVAAQAPGLEAVLLEVEGFISATS